MMKYIRILLIFSLLLLSMVSWADNKPLDSESIQIIVNAQSELTQLNRKQIMSLFLGRSTRFPNGKSTKAFDNKIGSALRDNFFEWLTRKSISDIDAYWARLRYSGRVYPPKVIDNLDDILETVRQNQSAIAYIRQQDPEQLAEQGITVVHTLRKR